MRMRRAWRGLALVLLLGALAAAPWAAGGAVQNLRDMLQKPAPEWEGVLTVGVVPSFPTMNLDGWLAAQSRAFEKQEGYVIVSLRTMTRAGVRAGAAAQTLPDALVFGMGVFAEPETLLTPLAEPDVRRALQPAGRDGETRYAVPLAMGGYGLLCNADRLEALRWSEEANLAETMALAGGAGLSAACPKAPYTDPLAALRAMGAPESLSVRADLPHEKIWAEFALDGDYALYVATQREVRRMEVLQERGSGVRTAFLAPEGAVYADQVLLAGIVQPTLTSAGERDAQSRRDCAEAFFDFLLGEEAQAGLVQAQLFSVTGAGPLYEAGTPMGALEASLAGDLELAPGFASLAAK